MKKTIASTESKFGKLAFQCRFILPILLLATTLFLAVSPAKAGYWEYNELATTNGNGGSSSGSGTTGSYATGKLHITESSTTQTILNGFYTPSWTWVADSSTDYPPAFATITFTDTATSLGVSPSATIDLSLTFSDPFERVWEYAGGDSIPVAVQTGVGTSGTASITDNLEVAYPIGSDSLILSVTSTATIVSGDTTIGS